MLIAAIIFFSLAIMFGLILLTYVWQNKPTPKSLAFIHGPLAITGLVLLIIHAINSAHHSTLLIISLILFVLAGIGGITLISLDLMGKPVSKTMALGHGSTAITAFVLLILSIV